MSRDNGYCCTGGDCCGPGSWCCVRAGEHTHCTCDDDELACPMHPFGVPE